MKTGNIWKMVVLALICLAVPANVQAEMSEEELARKIANPIVAMLIVPFQNNYESGIGPKDDGTRYTLNIQPILPFELNKDWNLITRPIVPIIFQDDIYPGAGSQSGLGDSLLSFFFSPVAPTSTGWIWGLGPALLFPTGSHDLLTTKKWGAGPTAVLVRQTGGLTYGALANHIWSYAGDDDRADVSMTLFQPMAAYTTHSAFTYILQLEQVYDWQNEESTSPIMAMISKVTRIAGQDMSFAFGVRYYLDAPDNGPEGFAFRFNITLLFPK